MRTVRRDINAVYSTGLFDDVNVSTREAEDSTETAPKVGPCPTVQLLMQRTRCGALCAAARIPGGLCVSGYLYGP